MNKKKITAVLLALLLVVAYLFSGKIINKLYLRGYEKEKIQGANRYETIISCGEGYWDNPKEAILINTGDIGSAMSAVPYAYANNIPLLLTEQGDLSSEIRKFIKENHLKKVYVLGGIRAVSKRVERDVERTGAKVERIIQINRGDISNTFAEMTVKQSKSKEMFVIFDGKNGYSIGVSILGKAAEKGMPILTVNESNLYKAAEFARENGIEKTYVIGRFNELNSTIDKVFPNVHRISGKDKFEVNRNVIKEFYDMDKVDKVYVVKGGNLIKGKTLNVGEFVNSIAAVPRIAKTGEPILINDTEYIQDDVMDFLKKYNIKKLCSVGFEIKKTSVINLDSDVARIVTSFILIIMIALITFRALKG
ncbi:cell wall-binding repeat-containing protein [Peptacetobacter hiranonis]|nr:cell wall-binding repeat-containing protein [Peptacetobacter hiranonis]QEK20254.1 N-acetylmuramoyl-L-alanine amidase LytC [Peptacetobacter hiranonis]